MNAAQLRDIAQKISQAWNGATVTDVSIDTEFGGVTATVDGSTCVSCGFIEDYGYAFQYIGGVS